jgi:hypothetical protein
VQALPGDRDSSSNPGSSRMHAGEVAQEVARLNDMVSDLVSTSPRAAAFSGDGQYVPGAGMDPTSARQIGARAHAAGGPEGQSRSRRG